MKNFTHSFILLCFLVGVVAPACGFSWGGKYSVVEICTAQGIEQRVVDTAPTDDSSPHKTVGEDCQFCFAAANMKAFLPADMPVMKAAVSLQKQRINHYTLIVLSRTTSHEEPRGPPVLS